MNSSGKLCLQLERGFKFCELNSRSMVEVLVAQVSGMVLTFSCPWSSAAGEGKGGHCSGDDGPAPWGQFRGSRSEAFHTNFPTGKRFIESWACV